jgi:hypothetical protein
MRLTLGPLIALAIKLALLMLKLDDQSAHLFRLPSIHNRKPLPERVSKKLDGVLLHYLTTLSDNGLPRVAFLIWINSDRCPIR